VSEKKRPLPTMQEIIDFLQNSEGKVGKRQIAKAFKIKGDDRIALKKMLNELKEAGTFSHKSSRSFFGGLLRSKLNAEITGFDSSGALIARPLEYNDDQSTPQIIIPKNADHISPPIKIGDIVVVKLKKAAGHTYNGEIVKRLSHSPNRIVGFYQTKGMGLGGILTSVDRRIRDRFYVSKQDGLNAENGSIVLADVISFRKEDKAKIIKVLAKSDTPFAATIISAYQHSVPLVFPEAAIKEANAIKSPTMEGREDLRPLPLVTIDGEDARDFDDAVWAEPDQDKANRGGWHLIVAISDIAWFVRPNTALDKSARERGNSVYFPDRAVHMLPENLPVKFASLLPREDRPVIACHLWIDRAGHPLRKKFTRAMIKSAARLNYHEVETVLNGGKPPSSVKPEIAALLNVLKGAFKSLQQYREERGCLNIEGKETQISLNDKGQITAITEREDLESYQLIEEFMIAANVAAAETLEELNFPVMYRVHDKPSEEKISLLNDFLDSLNIEPKIPANPTPKDFNDVLAATIDTKNQSSVNEMVLRSQSPARYSPENIGHFGLSLKSYAHFTSPIRRYADLLIHRSLIDGLRLGEGGFSDAPDMEEIADHITFTEKRADEAERDAESRYIALYLQDKIGTVLKGTVAGLSHAGLFIRLIESKGEGFCPMHNLHYEYFLFDEETNTLVGQNSGKTYHLGDPVTVELEEVNPVTGSIILSIADGSNRSVGSRIKSHSDSFKKHFWDNFKPGSRRHRW